MSDPDDKVSTKEHWEKVYLTKKPEEVSWTQEVPKISLEFIHSFNLPKTSKIIDVGGGESKLVDHLIREGFTDITVLDISENAIERAKKRLGNHSKNVKWIVCDIVDFEPACEYDLWHDRATFHFLTTRDKVAGYIKSAARSVRGYLVVGTFSETGPKKCSGLEIKQYSEESLGEEFQNAFEKIRCVSEAHVTPFDTVQNFIFCGFKKK